ncbi:hypothetical protein [Glaciecola sp. SC05]|uniref:hypothetical protein n=1 Tax=Glaciecola sp. SC05 TaxID=1987355 RepID=UPI0035285C73
MSKITTRQINELKDIFNDTVIRCAGLIKHVSKPMQLDPGKPVVEAHEYSHEYYVIAEVEALNIGPGKHNFGSVEVIIDTDSALESAGIFTSLQKAKNDGVYVIFDAAYLAVTENRALLQGARAEITDIRRDGYFNLISLGKVAR